MNRLTFAAVILVFSISPILHAEDTSAANRIANFTLRDYRGKQRSLNDYKDSKFVVIAVLGTDCPLVKLYAPRKSTLRIRSNSMISSSSITYK